MVEPQRFAIVPEWVLDLDVSDAALRLYALLLRYGGTSGTRMPSRRLLAERMRRSVDSVDRAMRDLETAGLVRVERRRRGRENLTNRYHVRTTNPTEKQRPAAAAQRPAETDATAQTSPRGVAADLRLPAPLRLPAVLRPGARVRPGWPQICGPTESKRPRVLLPPPLHPAGRGERDACDGGGGADDRSKRRGARPVRHHRPRSARRALPNRPGRALGLSATRWAAPCLLAAIQLAVLRGWPPEQIQPALLALAADRETRSPMRVAEAGPWWDQPPPPPPELDGVDLAALEAELDDVAEHRPALQAKARAELAAEHLPVTRATVTARAVQILHRSRQEVA